MQKNDGLTGFLKLGLKKNGKLINAEIDITPEQFQDLWDKYVVG
jgi:hypothetical protein